MAGGKKRWSLLKFSFSLFQSYFKICIQKCGHIDKTQTQKIKRKILVNAKLILRYFEFSRL